MDAVFPLLSIQRVRPIMTFGPPALVWRPCYRLDRYYSRLYSGIRKLDVFKQPNRLRLLAVPPSRRHLRPALLPR
jgi:hypothetical protein